MSNLKHLEFMESNESLLSVCLDLHMYCNGSSDYPTKQERDRHIKILTTARDNWVLSSKAFDATVYTLICITLREYFDSYEND